MSVIYDAKKPPARRADRKRQESKRSPAAGPGASSEPVAAPLQPRRRYGRILRIIAIIILLILLLAGGFAVLAYFG